MQYSTKRMQVQTAEEAERVVRIRQGGAKLANAILRDTHQLTHSWKALSRSQNALLSSKPEAAAVTLGETQPAVSEEAAPLPVLAHGKPTLAPEALRIATDNMGQFVESLIGEAKDVLGPTATHDAGQSTSRQDTREDVDEGPKVGDGSSGSTIHVSPALEVVKGDEQVVKGRPAWALTEQQCCNLQNAEEAELLQFAEELDFDGYIEGLDDEELATALKVCFTYLSGGRQSNPSTLKLCFHYVGCKHFEALKRILVFFSPSTMTVFRKKH